MWQCRVCGPARICSVIVVKVDIRTARNLHADFIFASFVQTADAVREIRTYEVRATPIVLIYDAGELAGPNIRIISKIESQVHSILVFVTIC
jgi:pyruvate kinase